MWRAVFLHEFLGLDIRNYQAVRGIFTASSSLGSPTREGNLALVRLFALEFLRFQLADPWEDVIGVSGRVRLRLPTQSVPDPVPVMRLGQGVELALQFQRPITPVTTDPAVEVLGRALLRVGAAQVTLASLAIPHRRFFELRFDWHTSGQVRLLVDGQLIGYQNAVAPGARLELTDVLVGDAPPIGLSRLPFYDVSRVFLRALRRPDALAQTVGLLGELEVPDDERLRRCVFLRTKELLALCDRLRSFMALFSAQETTPGDAMAGTLSGSFSAAAMQAHELAVESVRLLAVMVRSGDYAQADTFLDTFTALLEVLHDALPQEFEALVAEELEREKHDDECRELGEKVVRENRRILAPLLWLLEEAAERLRMVAGVS